MTLALGCLGLGGVGGVVGGSLAPCYASLGVVGMAAVLAGGFVLQSGVVDCIWLNCIAEGGGFTT